MNKKEVVAKLAEHGIHQLRKGESVQDALDYVDGKILRVGHQIKHDDGRPMSKNQIIQASNKEAFLKGCPNVKYLEDEVEDIDDICGENDRREDETKRGILMRCYYCGTSIRVDDTTPPCEEDYAEPPSSIDHCSSGDCFANAVRVNCM